MTKYMATTCWDCGKHLESDGKQAVEIWWKAWQNKLTPNDNVKIVCMDCFGKYANFPTKRL